MTPAPIMAQNIKETPSPYQMMIITVPHGTKWCQCGYKSSVIALYKRTKTMNVFFKPLSYILHTSLALRSFTAYPKSVLQSYHISDIYTE
jgi:hypothetical protein